MLKPIFTGEVSGVGGQGLGVGAQENKFKLRPSASNFFPDPWSLTPDTFIFPGAGSWFWIVGVGLQVSVDGNYTVL